VPVVHVTSRSTRQFGTSEIQFTVPVQLVHDTELSKNVNVSPATSMKLDPATCFKRSMDSTTSELEQQHFDLARVHQEQLVPGRVVARGARWLRRYSAL
jgi:hypothetical protein